MIKDYFNKILNENIYDKNLLMSLVNIFMPNLLINEKELIIERVGLLMNFIIDKMDINIEQFYVNNYENIKALILNILPYCNNEELKKVKFLKDIYNGINNQYKSSLLKEQTEKLSDFKLNTFSVSNYFNTQYNNINIDYINIDYKNIDIYIDIYCILLLRTIEQFRNKLYVNWINIIPLIDYKESILYLKTKELMGLNIDNFYDEYDIYMNYRGLPIRDIYQTISYHFYHDIKKIKWLFYVENNISYYKILNNLLGIDFKESWEELIDKNLFIFNINLLLKNNPILIKTIIKFLYTNYSQKKKIRKEFPINIENKDLDDENKEEEENILILLEKIKDNELEEIVFKLNNNEENYFYEYLSEVYLDYRESFYYKRELDIPIKLLYNYSKSILRKNKDKFDIYELNYDSLDDFKKIFLKRLVGDDYSWFNVNLTRYNISLDKVKLYFKNNIIDIIFESQIKHGILTQFKPNPSIKDNKILKKLYIKENKKKFKQSYHWGYLEKYKTNLYDNNKDYFDYLEDASFTDFYSLNWLMQINFFNHFINKRVHLITGATGLGKSVIIPKLISYGYNSYYYKNNWKVVATQPRIPPTINTAKFISEMIGYPLKEYNIIQKEKVISRNTLIQYQYAEDKFIGNKNQKRFLRIMTDGLLYITLINNLLLKENDNIYDSVIIDEAHEHNANMDMILTLMKTCVYWNNSIKLFIVSATIDEDEARYRYYYHNINDLYRYPLMRMQINTNLLDMRIDISSPNKTTQYKIDEYYGKHIEFQYINQALISKVIEIAYTDSNNNILVFTLGLSDIKKIVIELNKRLNNNSISIPYYSELHQDYKSIVEKLDENMDKLPLNKNDIMNLWGEKIRKFPLRKYQQVVIIATNLAEASITIDNLKYVVDSGYQKTNILDRKNNQKNLIEQVITESSRIQRKGRVGRKAPGVVYYLYPKDTRNINKTYKICNEDFSNYFIKLYPSNIKNLIFNKDNNLMDINEIQLNKDFKKILKHQYQLVINDKKDWIFNIIDDKYDIDDYEFNLYIDGYDLDNIKDVYGNFYLIHPYEEQIIRNYNFNISSFKENNKFLEIPRVPIKETKLLSHNLLSLGYINEDFEKREYFINLDKLNSELKLNNYSLSEIIVGGYEFNNLNDALLLVAFFIKNETSIFNHLPKRDYNKSEMEVLIYYFNLILKNIEKKKSDYKFDNDLKKYNLNYIEPSIFDNITKLKNEGKFNKKNINIESKKLAKEKTLESFYLKEFAKFNNINLKFIMDTINEYHKLKLNLEKIINNKDNPIKYFIDKYQYNKNYYNNYYLYKLLIKGYSINIDFNYQSIIIYQNKNNLNQNNNITITNLNEINQINPYFFKYYEAPNHLQNNDIKMLILNPLK